jgi:hypothetical protein
MKTEVEAQERSVRELINTLYDSHHVDQYYDIEQLEFRLTGFLMVHFIEYNPSSYEMISVKYGDIVLEFKNKKKDIVVDYYIYKTWLIKQNKKTGFNVMYSSYFDHFLCDADGKYDYIELEPGVHYLVKEGITTLTELEEYVKATDI